MRYFYALSLLLALGLSRSAHAQQPFLKYGVTVKVATLSNGRFQEFFTNDSLRRIGSVVYDTRLRRVAYLLPPDSLVGHAKADITSRWMSPDPLAEKYMYISPYVYGNDNPVRYSDHDGREIVDSKGKAVTINKDGGFAYAGKDASIITFVGELSKNDAGRETLTGLVNVATKINVEITTDRGFDRGAKETEGHTDGRGSIIDPKTGKEVYKTADITIYTGTHDSEVQEGSGQYAKDSEGKYVNGVATHEGNHVLNDLESNKKVAKESGLTGKPLDNAQEKARETVPNEQERRANSTYPNP